MIRVDAIAKNFGPVGAVNEVSFSSTAGEIFGLLGPNGAGKTTLLRMLSTILRPSSGRATLGGYDVVGEAERVRRIIGVLPANAGLYGRLTAVENLRYFGTLHGMPRAYMERRIAELLDRLDLRDAAVRRAEAMSSGMRQKVALARAILHDPAILLLDEPTEGLDVPTARTVYRMVEELRDQSRCIVFSTHRMAEAERLCTRIGVIARGSLVALGTQEELRQRSGTDNLEEAFLRLIGDNA